VLGQGKIGNLLMSPRLNGSYMDPVYSGPVSPCPIGQSFCVVTGTVWFDIDQLEAKNPGEFVGQPLNIELYGGAISGSDPTANYVATFSAEVASLAVRREWLWSAATIGVHVIGSVGLTLLGIFIARSLFTWGSP